MKADGPKEEKEPPFEVKVRHSAIRVYQTTRREYRSLKKAKEWDAIMPKHVETGKIVAIPTENLL